MTPRIETLGHVGIFCFDLDVQTAFYRDVLGLTVTDADLEKGLVFLSARPGDEHHEVLLQQGRDVTSGRWLQQVSFRCSSLDDVLGFLARFEAADVRLDQVVTHGNAVGVYFFDPEGNRCEVYWPTGVPVPQPHLRPIDLHREASEVLAEVRAGLEGTTP